MISLKSVSLSFGEKKVLENLSLDISDGGITCFFGPSGCGKTTLLKAIAGLIPIDSGEIVHSFKKPALMFQEDRLIPWLTALQNVTAVLPQQDFEKAAYFLREVGLENEQRALPSELSGGMRRRAAFARALAYGGDLLLLDEPFKGIDRELTAKLSSLVAGSGIPALVITHSEDEIELLGGRVLRFSGPPLTLI